MLGKGALTRLNKASNKMAAADESGRPQLFFGVLKHAGKISGRCGGGLH